ncbi:MAG TPA: IS630 transposase-related protein [Pyrinomonadaceae bacterium]|jgi:transposase|nr:IS630 transposase-related protein [Pyrinomonadaceae bacterium]
MRAYSLDLRERVVAAYEKGTKTIAEIAAQFSVGQTFLKKMLRQKRESGSLERLPQRAGAKKALSATHHRYLAQQIKEQPDTTLAELQERYRTGTQ